MDKNHNKQTLQEKADSGINKILGIFTFVVLCAFPIVYDDYYFNILQTKYKFYSVSAIVMIILAFGYGLYNGTLIKVLKTARIKSVMKKLTIVDWSLIMFWLANVISWVNCEWPWEAFWGTSGRFNGVFLMTIYLVVYFLITRCFKMKRIYLDAFLLASVFVCGFGITDYFQLDLLGFKEMMLEKQKVDYTSTIGNINTYTVYVGAVLGISMMLFALETCKKRTLYYFGVMAISMVALIVGTSDNAYLTLAALFGFSPLYLFRKKTWARRYVASVAMLLTSIMFIGWIDRTYAGVVYELNSIFKILNEIPFVPIASVVLWGVVLIWMYLSIRSQDAAEEDLGKGFVWLWTVVICTVVLGVIYVLYDANIAGNVEKYNAIKNYVVYSDSWGTNRGYVWSRSFSLYRDLFTPIQKLFGYGADTFRLLMMENFPPNHGYVYDSAHNEYLHFLITIGFVGSISYILVISTSIVTMIKRVNDCPEVVACLFVVFAYAVQAIVNINLPVVFPLIWQLLAMGLSKTEEQEEK